MSRPNPTETLATLIEEQFLDQGNLDPQVDDIVTAWRAKTSMTLNDSASFVGRRLKAALDYLNKVKGYHIIVPVTQARYAIVGEPDGDPSLKDIIPCVAGQGPGSVTFGIHFHTQQNIECWLWEIWHDFFDRVENGVKSVDRDNIERVVNSGQQSLDVTDVMLDKRLADNRADTKNLRAIDAASVALPTKPKVEFIVVANPDEEKA